MLNNNARAANLPLLLRGPPQRRRAELTRARRVPVPRRSPLLLVSLLRASSYSGVTYAPAAAVLTLFCLSLSSQGRFSRIFDDRSHPRAGSEKSAPALGQRSRRRPFDNFSDSIIDTKDGTSDELNLASRYAGRGRLVDWADRQTGLCPAHSFNAHWSVP